MPSKPSNIWHTSRKDKRMTSRFLKIKIITISIIIIIWRLLQSSWNKLSQPKRNLISWVGDAKEVLQFWSSCFVKRTEVGGLCLNSVSTTTKARGQVKIIPVNKHHDRQAYLCKPYYFILQYCNAKCLVEWEQISQYIHWLKKTQNVVNQHLQFVLWFIRPG